VNEIDEEVRQMLRERSRDVVPRFEVPTSLTTRTRRRIAVNALAVATTIVVASAGAFAGFRAVTRGVQPEITAPATCLSTQLRTTAAIEGAAGAREGAITLTNASGEDCVLRGMPAIQLVDGNGDPITTGITFLRGDPMWKKGDLPQPAGWPTVPLQHGDAASIQVRWSNWCPDGRPAPAWVIALADGRLDVDAMRDVFPPPCNGEGQPATIEVGPFEPAFPE
jgi:Protein of unknown function (DUF4232)